MLYGELNTITIDGTEYKGFRVNIVSPAKSAVVRMPTCDEIAEYLGAYQDVSKAKKNGHQKSDEAQRQPDIDLFKKIRLDSSEGFFDAFEAEHVVSRLTNVQTVSCERSGDSYVVILHTPFGDVTHTMRALSIKELNTYRTAVGRGNIDWRGNTILSLFNTTALKSEGYAEGTEVPPHHKSQVMSEVALAILSVDPVEIDPN